MSSLLRVIRAQDPLAVSQGALKQRERLFSATS